jgi:hypothetical protein
MNICKQRRSLAPLVKTRGFGMTHLIRTDALGRPLAEAGLAIAPTGKIPLNYRVVAESSATANYRILADKSARSR